jgi:hypothetical protein
MIGDRDAKEEIVKELKNLSVEMVNESLGNFFHCILKKKGTPFTIQEKIELRKEFLETIINEIKIRG